MTRAKGFEKTYNCPACPSVMTKNYEVYRCNECGSLFFPAPVFVQEFEEGE